jgi:hypothetical protein
MIKIYFQKVKGKKTWKKLFLIGIMKFTDEKSRMRILIRTKMLRIRNTDFTFMYFLQATLLEWETGAENSEGPNYCRVNKQNILVNFH